MRSGAPGSLSIVLHSHMPYVEGFGTWPFGEEWLWEATAMSYLPLLDLLDAAPGKLTISVTPVLADQWEAMTGEAGDRFAAFLRELRPESHRRDIASASDPGVAAALEGSAAAYAAAADAFERRGGDLVTAFAPHVTWTSAATHPILPLLATDAGVRLQLETGIDAHRARFGSWDGGFWLPECAYSPALDDLLEEAGVHVACVDLTDFPAVGRDVLATPAGPLLVPIDRHVVELVWSARGYPGGPAYADTHALTEHRHFGWANDGRAYDPARAAEAARADAAAFARHVAGRASSGGLSVCAIDTEFFGHHWREGVVWLTEAIAALEASGVSLVTLDDAVREAEALPVPRALPATSWGDPRTLATWSAPQAGGIAWRQRAAELAAVAADPSDRALRELLALQSSDWAFLITHGTAGPYPRDRLEGHLRAFEDAMAAPHDPHVRNLAPHLARWALALP